MENGLEIFDFIAKEMHLEEHDLRTYSPLTLAYLGDAVYEVIIRTIVVSKGNTQVNKLHKKSSALVKAEAQANIIKGIMEMLNEEEIGYYKRGRNAKSYTSAKNATIADYRMATGFEALIGYLYLSNQSERMMFLIQKGLDIIEERSN